jgi:hypothetical protein
MILTLDGLTFDAQLKGETNSIIIKYVLPILQTLRLHRVVKEDKHTVSFIPTMKKLRSHGRVWLNYGDTMTLSLPLEIPDIDYSTTVDLTLTLIDPMKCSTEYPREQEAPSTIPDESFVLKGKPDLINKPPHYTQGKIESIDFIRDQDFPYLAGTIIKYIVRYRWKGTALQDLKKARWYLDRLIAEYEK